ncbi:MAG: DUF3142 domain-containing protein [Thermoanaerobaculia bacterium]
MDEQGRNTGRHGREAAALLLFALLAACGPERASGPLRQEAYVWQRSWSPAVRASVLQARDFARLVVLAAEVDLRGRSPRVVRIPLDSALRASGRPVGAALRVTAFSSRFADEPRIARLLADLARSVTAEARSRGLRLSEVQIDYDCPESKLEDYAALLPALREAVAPVPVTITALPAWMRQRRAFGGLIRAADGYVLQVHSLTPPAGPGAEIVLCDPHAARGWIEEAARFGRPFRVALPTYGYAAAFNSKGKLLGLSAEGPLLSWPEGITLRAARTDPGAMAGLVRGWTTDRPAALAGILWYRLPVATDRLNWTLPTLRAVSRGETPRADVRAQVREPEPGLVEIDLLNLGTADSAPPPVSIRWRGSRLIAADGLAGYRVLDAGPSAARLDAASRGGVLRPGDRRTAAWLRFATRTEVHVELTEPGDPR